MNSMRDKCRPLCWLTDSPNCILRTMTFVLLLIGTMSITASAQGLQLSLDKTHNAPTPVPSGQTFTYTLAYSWSGGAPGTLIITDQVPPELDVLSTVPAATVTGNNVQFSLSGLTGSAGAGTVQINVRFKPGVTCPGERACNIAAIRQEGSDEEVKSKSVCATASAENKWTLEKTLFAGCALDNEVIFRICVKNPSGGDIGGLNLTDVTLTDVVPAGATVTNVSGSWSSFTQTGSNVTLSSGPSTLPVSAYNAWYCVYITLNFPSTSFNAGETVVNNARLTFRTPCDDPQGEPTVWTDQDSVTLCDANPSGQIWKGLSLNLYFPSNPAYLPTFTPGCCGTYRVFYKNNGNVAQPNVTITDELPPEVDLNSIRTQVPSGMGPCTLKVYCWSAGTCGTTACTTVVYNTPGTYLLTTVPANACKVEWEYGGSMPISTSLNNYLDVCVRSTSNATPFASVNSGDTITNLVIGQADNYGPVSTTHSKVVDAHMPKIITTKIFMGECTPGCTSNPNGPFVPGDIVRFRLAVANIGNLDATTCTITDALPSGLSYVGNETYFYGAFNWMASQYNPPCCSTSVSVPSQIGGPISTPTLGDTSLTWSFPTLPSRCDGTVEYFIIEFDVKISDDPPASPGQYHNRFTFDASNLGSPVTSNQATLTVNAVSQLQLTKEVRPAGSSAAFSSATSVPQGGQAEFRLQLTNTGNMSLQDICLLDIMPHNGDIQVLPGYLSRGSAYDMPTTGSLTIAPATGYTAGYNSSANTKNPMRSTVCGGFCGVADPTTGFGTLTNGIFGGTATSTYSFKVSSNAGITLAPGSTLTILANGQVPATAAVGSTACNSFAVQATPVGTSTCLKAEAAPACVRVEQGQQSDPCREIWRGGKPTDCCGYSLSISNTLGGLANLQYNVLPAPGSTSPSGVVQSVMTSPCSPTFTSPASLAGTTSGNLVFDPACTAGGPQQINFSASSSTSSGTICIELIATVVNKQGEKIECRDTICFECDPLPVQKCDSMSVKPFPYNNLDLSGRTFKIFNQKVPASPICSVKIQVIPPPTGPGVNGGGLYIDGVWKAWPWGSSNGYSEILTVHGMPAANTVQFNLGIDYTIGWVGNVLVTAYHCDGDSCTMDYGPWRARKGKPWVGGGVITGPKLSDSIRYYTLNVEPKSVPEGTQYISIGHENRRDSIVAITPASLPCDSASIANGECDDRISLVEARDGTALVSFARDLNRENGKPMTLTVFMLGDGERNENVLITFFDAEGNEIGTTEVKVETGTLTSDVEEGISAIAVPGGFNVQPNPTLSSTAALFRLDRSESSVRIELLDAAGRHVRTIVDGERMSAGEHRINVDLSDEASGTYFLLLQTDSGTQSRRIVVQR